MNADHSDRLYFTRDSERRTSDAKLRSGLDYIAQQALSGNRGRGWAYELGPVEASQVLNGALWLFTSWIRFYRRVETSPEREAEQRQEIYQWAAAAGHSARFGQKPWKRRVETVTRGEGKTVPAVPESAPESSESPGSEESKPLPAPPIDLLADAPPTPLSSISRIQPNHHFDHLIGLDAQIRIFLSSIQAAADSNMKNRFHTLLHGKPGTGKTDILLSTSKLLTEMNVSHLLIDATSTSEAGMRNLLLDEDAILPEIIMVEEIEKAKHSFHLLLGIMDDRGTITQMNARRTASRKVPALVLASANDYDLLRRTDSGALLSRFNNEIYCPRLGRDALGKVLKRYVAEVKGGDERWIEPTLVFCYDERKITDPRMLKRVCLCGKERLLTGQYQKDLAETMRVVGSSGINLEAFK